MFEFILLADRVEEGNVILQNDCVSLPSTTKMSDPSDPANASNPLASSDAGAPTTETDDVVRHPADEASKSQIHPSPSQSEAAKVESQDSEAVPEPTNSATSKSVYSSFHCLGVQVLS